MERIVAEEQALSLTLSLFFFEACSEPQVTVAPGAGRRRSQQRRAAQEAPKCEPGTSTARKPVAAVACIVWGQLHPTKSGDDRWPAQATGEDGLLCGCRRPLLLNCSVCGV